MQVSGNERPITNLQCRFGNQNRNLQKFRKDWNSTCMPDVKLKPRTQKATSFLRRMARNGFAKKAREDFRYKFPNTKILEFCKSKNVSDLIEIQQVKLAAHTIIQPSSYHVKQVMFKNNHHKKAGVFTKPLPDQFPLIKFSNEERKVLSFKNIRETKNDKF